MECPYCKSDLRGEPIRDDYFEHQPNCALKEDPEGKCFCMPYGWREPEDRFYSRQILIYVPAIYDGGAFYKCPDCGYDWHRFDDAPYGWIGDWKETVEKHMELPPPERTFEEWLDARRDLEELVGEHDEIRSATQETSVTIRELDQKNNR